MSERTPKILVVDDDPRLRDLLRRYLGENGFQVLVSENGQAMERLWLREHFDALILDLMMPGEDGLEILKRLRAQKDQTPVIMLTARGEDVDRILGLELGADDYIPKPFNPRELLARIHAVLALDGGKRQVARLSGKAAEETVDGEQTDLHAVAAQVQYEAVEHGRRDRAHKAADAALDRLVRAQRRGKLGLAEAAADEKRAGVAHPRDDERQQQVRRFGVVQAKAHERREHPRDDNARREHERQILKRDALGLVKRDHHLDEHGHEQHVGRDLEHELRLSERRAEHDGRAAHAGIHRKARHELRHGRVQQLPGAERRHDGHHDAPTPDRGEEDHGQQRRDADAEKAAGVADSQTERSILKERPVVPPPDGPAAQRVHKAGPNRFGQWEQIEQAQPQQAGQQKRQCLPALPPAQASDLWPFHRLHLLAYTVAQGT